MARNLKLRNVITIYFDGGCRPTNPGNKYGSWEVQLEGNYIYHQHQVEFGHGTNNEAEFEALLAALDWTLAELPKGGFIFKAYTLQLFTDSTIVHNRIQMERTGGKEEAAQRMGKLTQQCLDRLKLFNQHSISWQRRDHNVIRFGH